MVFGRKAGFGAGQVEPDDGQLELRFGLHGRPDQLLRGQGKDPFALGMGVDMEQGVEILGKPVIEHAHGAGDDAVFEGRLGAAFHFGARVEFLLGPGQAAVERGHGVDAGQAGVLMQLRREAHLDVAHPFGLVVLGQLVAHPLQGGSGLQHRRGVGESLQIFGQAGVFAFENQTAQSLLVISRQLDPVAPWASSIRVDRRSEPSRCRCRSVFGIFSMNSLLMIIAASRPWMIRAISGLLRAISSGLRPFNSWGKTSHLSVSWMIVIGPAVGAVVAGLEVDRGHADVVGRVAPRKAVQGVDDGLDAQAGVVDVIHDQQAVRPRRLS